MGEYSPLQTDYQELELENVRIEQASPVTCWRKRSQDRRIVTKNDNKISYTWQNPKKEMSQEGQGYIILKLVLLHSGSSP